MAQREDLRLAPAAGPDLSLARADAPTGPRGGAMGRSALAGTGRGVGSGQAAGSLGADPFPQLRISPERDALIRARVRELGLSGDAVTVPGGAGRGPSLARAVAIGGPLLLAGLALYWYGTGQPPAPDAGDQAAVPAGEATRAVAGGEARGVPGVANGVAGPGPAAPPERPSPAGTSVGVVSGVPGGRVAESVPGLREVPAGEAPDHGPESTAASGPGGAAPEVLAPTGLEGPWSPPAATAPAVGRTGTPESPAETTARREAEGGAQAPEAQPAAPGPATRPQAKPQYYPPYGWGRQPYYYPYGSPSQGR
jgi:hypothetical protein